ncbi:hypothetical protein L1987_20280 [Smallanthus sonchifolius]|uniref:Uncharacterized protein n=1 Tax=Smallanthus sonchifolius TaxID=185202 RepID=A0ACB9ISK6_9ASTR|nr:hypothetical protein L1987_20280 [Smallanthus sonchifolius]
MPFGFSLLMLKECGLVLTEDDEHGSAQYGHMLIKRTWTRFTWHALKHMKEGSSIINTTSVDAYSRDPQLVDYSSTKGAIVLFTSGLALQLLQKGIRVNGVAPVPVYTPIRPATMDKGDMS